LYDINVATPALPNLSFCVYGAFLMWTSWLFFNGSCGEGVSPGKLRNLPSKIVMNTLLSSAGSTIFLILFRNLILVRNDPTNKFDTKSCIGAMLAGLTAINASCNNIEPWAALVIGILASLFYCLAIKLLDRLKIDDPAEAIHIHLVAGLWGLIAVGIFDNTNGLIFTGKFK
jgi:Amt family ammonium transporter